MRGVTQCIECGRERQHGETGWRVLHMPDPDAPSRRMVGLYCPVCAVREFGAGDTDVHAPSRGRGGHTDSAPDGS